MIGASVRVEKSPLVTNFRGEPEDREGASWIQSDALGGSGFERSAGERPRACGRPRARLVYPLAFHLGAKLIRSRSHTER